ncbi:MAG: nucleotidyltransferase [Terriglobales bacterium]
MPLPSRSEPRPAAGGSIPPDAPHYAPAPVLVAEQRQLFQRVLGALSRGGVGFAVAGAFAFQHYTGIWRFTKDLDLFLPAEKIDVALTLCRTAGLVTEITDPVWLAKAWAGDYYVDLISGMSNGVFWVTPAWIEQARPGEVLGGRYRLLAPEEMILSKLFVTRRERFDGSDVCHLVYRCGETLDWPRLIASTGEHWEMLLWHLMLFRYAYPAAPGAVPRPVWRELMSRFAAGMGGAAPRASFRGSLLDPLLFAPDVTEGGLENLEDALRRRRLQARAAEGNPPAAR